MNGHEILIWALIVLLCDERESAKWYMKKKSIAGDNILHIPNAIIWLAH